MSAFGAFKGLYRGYGLYFSRGQYVTDSLCGEWPTIAEARGAVDRAIASREAREKAEKDAKIAAGAVRAVRDGDNVVLHLPDGPRTMTIREYRRDVFDLEDRYGEIVMEAKP